MSLRNSYSRFINQKPTTTATSIGQLVGSGHGPGPTFIFKSAAHPSETTNEDDQTGRPDMRKVSPAEEALRHTLSSGTGDMHKAPSRTLSWGRKLFNRNKPIKTETQSLKSRFSDDTISVLEYVEPQTVTESPQAILDRVRARKEERQETPLASVAAPEVADIQVSSVSSPAGTLFVPDDLAAPEVADTHGTLVLSLAGTLSIHEAEESDGVTVSSLQTDAFADEVQEDANVSPSPLSPIPAPSGEASEAPVTLSLPVTNFAQQPVEPPREQLAVSAVKLIVHQVLAIDPNANGLPLFSSVAIIYGCTTFAAFRFALNNLGTDVDTLHLLDDMVGALLHGMVLCILLHAIGGGRIQKIWRTCCKGWECVWRWVIKHLWPGCRRAESSMCSGSA